MKDKQEEIQTNIDQLEDLILEIEDVQSNVDNSRDRREIAMAIDSLDLVRKSQEYLLEVLEDE